MFIERFPMQIMFVRQRGASVSTQVQSNPRCRTKTRRVRRIYKHHTSNDVIPLHFRVTTSTKNKVQKPKTQDPSSKISSLFLRRFFALKHLEHSIGDDKPAYYIGSRTDNGDESENCAYCVVFCPSCND